MSASKRTRTILIIVGSVVVVIGALLLAAPSIIQAMGVHKEYTGPRYTLPGGKALIMASDYDKRMEDDPGLLAKVYNSIPVSDLDFADHDIIFLAGGWGAAYDLGFSEELGDKITEGYAADAYGREADGRGGCRRNRTRRSLAKLHLDSSDLVHQTNAVKHGNVHEAKTHLSRILQEVERGEVNIISRNGTPVAELRKRSQPARCAPDSVLSQVRIEYDPTEELTPDEWGEIS